MGIDVLNPVQWRCPGMDPVELKDSLGDRVCFHGGIDNQEVMPFGTPADVRAEVTDRAVCCSPTAILPIHCVHRPGYRS